MRRNPRGGCPRTGSPGFPSWVQGQDSDVDRYAAARSSRRSSAPRETISYFNQGVCCHGKELRTMTLARSKGILEEIRKRIVEGVDPDRLVLFGSRARGSSRGDSDYDICVLKEGVKRRRRLAQRIYRLLLGVGASVDVIVETPRRFEELKANPFMVYSEIARHGRIIYEKPQPC